MSPNAHAVCKPSQQAFVLLAAHLSFYPLLVLAQDLLRQAKSKDLEGADLGSGYTSGQGSLAF